MSSSISLKTTLEAIEGMMPHPACADTRLAMKAGFLAGLMLAPASIELREVLRAEALKELNILYASIGAKPVEMDRDAVANADWTK